VLSPLAREELEHFERVMALRASGDVVKARQLLYEVLVEGGEDQVFVARNILSQLDQPG